MYTGHWAQQDEGAARLPVVQPHDGKLKGNAAFFGMEWHHSAHGQQGTVTAKTISLGPVERPVF